MKSLRQTHPKVYSQWFMDIKSDRRFQDEVRDYSTLTNFQKMRERALKADQNMQSDNFRARLNANQDSSKTVLWKCKFGHVIANTINGRILLGCGICRFKSLSKNEERIKFIEKDISIFNELFFTATHDVYLPHKKLSEIFLDKNDVWMFDTKGIKIEDQYPFVDIFKASELISDFRHFIAAIYSNPKKLSAKNFVSAIETSLELFFYVNNDKLSSFYIQPWEIKLGCLEIMNKILEIIDLKYTDASAFISTKIKKIQLLEIKESDPKTTAKPRSFIWNETESELKRIFLSLTKEKDKRLNYIDETSWETFRDVFIESKEEKKKYKRITWTREAQLLSYLIHSFIQMDLIKKCSHNKIIEDRFKILECDNPEKFKSKDHLDWKKKLQTPNDAIDLMHLLKVSEYDFEKS